jgi:hypothetical protein
MSTEIPTAGKQAATGSPPQTAELTEPVFRSPVVRVLYGAFAGFCAWQLLRMGLAMTDSVPPTLIGLAASCAILALLSIPVAMGLVGAFGRTQIRYGWWGDELRVVCRLMLATLPLSRNELRLAPERLPLQLTGRRGRPRWRDALGTRVPVMCVDPGNAQRLLTASSQHALERTTKQEAARDPEGSDPGPL